MATPLSQPPLFTWNTRHLEVDPCPLLPHLVPRPPPPPSQIEPWPHWASVSQIPTVHLSIHACHTSHAFLHFLTGPSSKLDFTARPTASSSVEPSSSLLLPPPLLHLISVAASFLISKLCNSSYMAVSPDWAGVFNYLWIPQPSLSSRKKKKICLEGKKESMRELIFILSSWAWQNCFCFERRQSEAQAWVWIPQLTNCGPWTSQLTSVGLIPYTSQRFMILKPEV